MANNETFAPGDVVQLKSGGPKMTVIVAGPSWVEAVWFAEGKPYKFSFAHVAIEAVQESVAS